MGEGFGACAVARLGRRVILNEEIHWIGGQLTNQAVPPDDHPWISDQGISDQGISDQVVTGSRVTLGPSASNVANHLSIGFTFR
ncbi:MAG TPA: FAD-dependent oxidoreductase [Blastocatellia bacterium]